MTKNIYIASMSCLNLISPGYVNISSSRNVYSNIIHTYNVELHGFRYTSAKEIN